MSAHAKLQFILFFFHQRASKSFRSHLSVLLLKTSKVGIQWPPFRNLEQQEPNAKQVIPRPIAFLGHFLVLRVLVELKFVLDFR